MIDVCFVAGRRPELIKSTLQSFKQNLFDNFVVSGFYANIDPVFGTEKDHLFAKEAIFDFFPSANIIEPEQPNFCAAVKRNWERTSATHIFHLEDDWNCEYSITPDIIEQFEIEDVMQVSFLRKGKKWNYKKRGKFHFNYKKRKILGFKLPLKIRNRSVFTTSPCFLKGEFARTSASLMDIRFDPEKQFYAGVNRRLENYVGGFKNLVFSNDGGPLIADIGREWREARGIEKTITNGVSHWSLLSS